MTEDPEICGLTRTIGRTEWICIMAPHDRAYRRRTSSKTHRRGEIVYSNNPAAERHYFVNRYPTREKSYVQTVEVTEENIDLFQLDVLTGNSKEVLLQLAEEAETAGHILHVKVSSDLVTNELLDVYQQLDRDSREGSVDE